MTRILFLKMNLKMLINELLVIQSIYFCFVSRLDFRRYLEIIYCIALYSYIINLYSFCLDSVVQRMPTLSGHIGSHIIAIALDPGSELLQDFTVDFRHLKVKFTTAHFKTTH